MYNAVQNPFVLINIFPPDVTPAGKFLLCLLHLSGPISNTALKMVLKPLICDDNVSPTIQALVDGRYLHSRDTDQGKFYALTAQTEAYIDYRDETTHRKQVIADRSLLTYRLESGILAEKLVAVAAKLYLNAWDKLTAEQRNAYLHGKYSQYHLKDFIGFTAFEAAFREEIQRATVKTVDLLPRSLVTQEDVIQAMADSVQAGKIPFTLHFNKALYHNYGSEWIKRLLAYDTAQSYKLSLSAKRQAAKLKMDTDEQSAKAFLKARHELGKLAQSMKELTPTVELLTYRHGKRILSLHILELNGIFLRGHRDGTLFFGILNNSIDGLPAHILDARMDYIVSFANKLGKNASVMLYSAPGDAQRTAKRIAALTAPAKPATSYAIPKVSYHSIPATVKLRHEVWHNFLSFLTASNIPAE